MKIEKVNIGEIIRRKVDEKGLSHKRFAEMIGKHRQNVNKYVFEKTSIDTNLLCDISEVLECNLFNYYKSNENNDIQEVKATITIEMGNKKKDRTIHFTFENEDTDETSGQNGLKKNVDQWRRPKNGSE